MYNKCVCTINYLKKCTYIHSKHTHTSTIHSFTSINTSEHEEIYYLKVDRAEIHCSTATLRIVRKVFYALMVC